MTRQLRIHFSKSIKLTKYLGISLLEDFIDFNKAERTHEVINYNNFYDYAMNRDDYGINKELIREVLSIEYEKTKIGDSLEKIKEINEYEKKLNIDREKLLYLNEGDIMKILFTTNPYIEPYESYWEIISDSLSYKDITENLYKEKSDFYFLYQRIGVFDKKSQNNVIDFSLTKYEYFVLLLFEESKTLNVALEEFSAIFEYNTQEEYYEIQKNFMKIIRDAIFRKFMITAYR